MDGGGLRGKRVGSSETVGEFKRKTKQRELGGGLFVHECKQFNLVIIIIMTTRSVKLKSFYFVLIPYSSLFFLHSFSGVKG